MALSPEELEMLEKHIEKLELKVNYLENKIDRAKNLVVGARKWDRLASCVYDLLDNPETAH